MDERNSEHEKHNQNRARERESLGEEDVSNKLANRSARKMLQFIGMAMAKERKK